MRRTASKEPSRRGRWAAVALALTASLSVGAAPAHSAYPGDNGRIAFSSNRDGGPSNFELYSIEPDGSAVTRLTTTAEFEFDRFPVWSPDGRRLAFERDGEIWVMNADGSGQQRLTDNSFFDSHPTWSPDGDRIAFERRVGVDFDVWVMNADGSGGTNLTPGTPSVDATPVWSVDDRIAFVSNRAGPTESSYDVFVMGADGSAPVRLTDDPAFDGQPAWSPDGERIAFNTNRDPQTAFDYEIYVMNADGSGETNLTNYPFRDDEPAWSPDGARITFSRQTVSGIAIFAMDADGSDQALVSGPAETVNSQPDWQPRANRPPACSGVTAAPGTLAPADRALRLVDLGGATDPDGDTVTLSITGVTQDEALTGGEDHTAPDAFSRQLTHEPEVAALLDNEPHQVYLRAERRNGGDGRVYRISFAGSDGRGGECSGTAAVRVLRRGSVALDSAPPSFDSFGS